MNKYDLALMLVLAAPAIAFLVAPYIAGWLVELACRFLRV